MEAEDDRLQTALLVDAQMRKLSAQAIPAYVINRGAYAAGLIVLKINALEEGCMVLVQQRDIAGDLGWMSVFGDNTVDEFEADSYINRALERDPDIWVIEVEDRQRRNPFEGKVF